MGFRENLQYLRSTRDMSQADLAQQLDVSRQSVAKWEAEKSYPEMDKLIRICDLFECSLDELVRGDLAGVEGEVEAEAVCETEVAHEAESEQVHCEKGAVPLDEFGYDEHMRRRAWDYAVGVAAIVLSVGVGLLMVHPGPGFMYMPLCIAVGIGIVVAILLAKPAYTSHQVFLREHPHIEDFYTPEQKTEARRQKAFGIVGAIVLSVAGLNVPGLFAMFHQYTFTVLAMFLCFAAAVGVLVYTIMMDRRIDVALYNAAAPAATAKEC